MASFSQILRQKALLVLLPVLLLLACGQPGEHRNKAQEAGISLVVLGIAQDGGYPQAGCEKACCRPVWEGRQQPRRVVSLGLVDNISNHVYLFDATPNFRSQLHDLLGYLPAGQRSVQNLGGIFLTHAHTGHYTGLMHLGREAMGAHGVAVYAMPRMLAFLQNNGPWNQLVTLQNIALQPLRAGSSVHLPNNITVTPILVPHRDEYSETVGFHIRTPAKSVLFIPDIDKWQKWQHNIVEEVKKVDYALLDATFYSEGELPNRNMKEIPHPFVPETMQLFENQPDSVKRKIYFIHFNHTNPLMLDGPATTLVRQKGFNLAREDQQFKIYKTPVIKKNRQ